MLEKPLREIVSQLVSERNYLSAELERMTTARDSALQKLRALEAQGGRITPGIMREFVFRGQGYFRAMGFSKKQASLFALLAALLDQAGLR